MRVPLSAIETPAGSPGSRGPESYFAGPTGFPKICNRCVSETGICHQEASSRAGLKASVTVLPHMTTAAPALLTQVSQGFPESIVLHEKQFQTLEITKRTKTPDLSQFQLVGPGSARCLQSLPVCAPGEITFSLVASRVVASRAHCTIWCHFISNSIEAWLNIDSFLKF